MPKICHRAILVLVVGIVFFFAYKKGSENSITRTRTNFLKAVNKTLEDAINHVLLVTPDSYNAKPAGYIFVGQLQNFQDELACLVEAGKGVQDSNSCLSLTNHRVLATYMSLVCNKLDSKRLLLLGPSLTFTLHNHLLSYVSRNSPPHTCLGPEFCTFHHICLPPSQSDNLVIPKKLDRHLKPPSPRDLFLTHSSLMHYIQSSSLYSSPNKTDLVYTVPTVDSENGVRVKEMYWLGPARRADLIVLNRGPIPAPAWTYDGSAFGNWSFINCLPYVPRLASSGLDTKRGEDLSPLSIINAAIAVTLSKFVPEVLQTLHVLRSDAGTKLKLIIWHGSSYRFRRGQCEYSRNGGDVETGIHAEDYLAGILERTNMKSITVDRRVEDPWGLYHDTQVYMQEHILKSVLPHWNIIFLPLDVGVTAPVKSKSNHTKYGLHKGRGRNCTRCCREEERAVGENFLGGLGFILDKLSKA